jgi:O-antigen/teichoic acid export membrane protein
MSVVATVARNTIFGFAGQLALKVIQLVTAAVLARALGAAGFGDFGYLVAVLTFFQFVGDLGTEKIALREIARDPDRAPAIVGAAMTLRAALSTAAAVLALTFFLAAAPTPRIARLGVLAASTLPFTLASIYPVYYQATLRVGPAARLLVLQGALGSALLLAAALLPGAIPALASLRLELAAIALAAAPLAALAASAWAARDDIRPRFAGDRALWGRLLAPALPLAFNSLCILVSLRADQVILRWISGAEALGHYAAALRFYDAFTIVPAVLLLSGFPLMARAGAAAPDRLRETAGWSYKLLSTFILPVALAVTLLAEPIVRATFGPAFVQAAAPLAILTWSLFFVFASMVTFDAITAGEKQGILIGLSIFTTAVNLALNLLWIPRYGANGAAAAALVYSAANLPVLALLPDTRPLVAALIRASWRPLLAIALLALAARLGAPRVPFLVALLPAYLLLLVASGALGRRDLDLLRRAARRPA